MEIVASYINFFAGKRIFTEKSISLRLYILCFFCSDGQGQDLACYAAWLELIKDKMYYNIIHCIKIKKISNNY